ncbi:hypothetical protein BU15DRAFT_63807 [Melanogaster broomeanus]|nr:hypothetical protein BU15DRAFT_63807 [Melanogaster broomeanus]
MANPHVTVVPDYTTVEYTEARAIFTAEGKSDHEAAAILTNVWRFNNTRACQLWDRQQEEAEQARLAERARLTEIKEQERVAREEEEELTKREERKKYKNKYIPIPNTPLSDAPIFTPCRYADAKTRQGDYCPLFYYTNRGHGLAEVKAKNCTLDEDLTWEEFSEAKLRMLGDMKRHSWDKDRIDMVRAFWIEIESHHWRHSTDEFNKRALLVFQEQNPETVARVHRDSRGLQSSPYI